MLKKGEVGSFELGAQQVQEVGRPWFVGEVRFPNKEVEIFYGQLVFNDETGEKYLHIFNYGGLYGKLFRKGVQDGKALYHGFIRPLEDDTGAKWMDDDVLWDVELSALGEVDASGHFGISGAVFLPIEAATHSLDFEVKKIGMPF